MGEPTSRTCKGCNIEFETTRKQQTVSFHSPVDIVAFRGDDGPAFRIEVRTAYRRGERLYHPPPRPGRYDVLAAVTADEIVYSLTLPEK
jgi:homogentisate 1,2-dioxygenase